MSRYHQTTQSGCSAMKAASPIAPAPIARPGFTLVELLIVIGIVVVLISLLMPALHKAMTSRITCGLAGLQQEPSFRSESGGILEPR